MAFRKANSLLIITSLSIALVAGVGSMGCDSASTAPNGTPGGILGIGGNTGNNTGNNTNTGGSTPSEGTGTGNAQADIANTLSATQVAVGLGLSKALTAPAKTQIADMKAQTIATQTVNCTPSGDETVDGDVTIGSSGIDFNLDLLLNSCAGLSGNLNVVGSEQINTTTGAADFTYKLDGNVGGVGCTATFNQFEIKVSVGSLGSTPLSTLNGVLAATCSGTNVNCTYTNVGTTDTATLNAACN